MRFKIFFESSDNDMVMRAFEFAKEKHRSQVRKGSGLPYIVHPEMVMELCKKFVPDCDDIMLAASLLHDTLEDTKTTYEEIKNNFGQEVADIVQELTSDEEELNKLGKAQYLTDKMNKISDKAKTIKLLDRLHNLKDIPKDGNWFKKYSEQTKYILSNIKNINTTQQKIIDEINKIINN